MAFGKHRSPWGTMSVRSRLISGLARPFKFTARKVLGDTLYQQVRVSLLGELNGLGLDWRWGHSLRRVHPVRRDFGWQAGQPIDRYYTEEHFFPAHRADIRGSVLEIGDNRYTMQFGDDRVTRSEVLHLHAGSPGSTIHGDLTQAPHIPSDSFDCLILTFTLQFIYDVRAALRTVARILKPDGVALVVVPGISQIARYDMDTWGEYWRFTSLSARLLFEEVFRPEDVTVSTYGNVLSATASLQGLISTELRREELDSYDRDYQVLIGIRAVKR
ncbi:MAG: hypothetical protein NBKEAIPA_01425 [Nitrospirae bacterium]|nr:MAG: putative sAM-dependent methyltransferase [Nitrospira sp. OLB3]MBV6469527.1 hypothetical protein [Nitrospirota bacterium]